MGRGKFKGKPTGRRQFSTPEEMHGLSVSWCYFPDEFEMVLRALLDPVIRLGLMVTVLFYVLSCHHPRREQCVSEMPTWQGSLDDSMLLREVEVVAGTSSRPRTFKREEAEVEEEHSEEESEEEPEERRKGTQGLIEVENPNLVKPKTLKARDIDIEKTTELSRREREEIEKQKAHERYMRLQEQGKTEQAKKDLERLALIRQQRADAAKKREEEKAAKEQKKAEARK
ncbi:28 kDa heat- and acid-stable phosphoprotein [Vitis vinifera]|uniref:28 kDa heat-and acid-stable phosphoprotein n=1 Tax=Vitis vinifera TaxID=29760 RepID=A0A438DR96_VITVI|nr:28 kDa heat- and acid-stable phosphoprotein [Vitis vinifera]